METIKKLSIEDVSLKIKDTYLKYVNCDKNNNLAIGVYFNGNLYTLSHDKDNNPNMFELGSVSKTIVAHLVLKLHYQGNLNIYKQIDEYLDLPRKNYPSIYELLTHTSGYSYFMSFTHFVSKIILNKDKKKNLYYDLTSDNIISMLKKKRVYKNKKYRYSDFNYAIIAVILEKILNKRFYEIIDEFIKNDLKIENIKVSLNTKKESGRWFWNLDNPFIASGGLNVDLTSGMKYLKILLESDESCFIESYKICDKSYYKNEAMCIGWHTYKNSNVLWSVGKIGSFCSSIIFNRKRKIGVIVLGNSRGKGKINVNHLSKVVYSELKKKRI